MNPTQNPQLHVYIDADACPVRDEIYKVAARHHVPVCVVSNSYLRIPKSKDITQITVSDASDAADDYIAQRVDTFCVVITADILLAERCLQKSAIVLDPKGKAFTADNIGALVASRALMNELRETSPLEGVGGPSAFTPADRSYFLQNLHEVLVQLKRGATY